MLTFKIKVSSLC